MSRPTEGDWECAYRVLKNCHPYEHRAASDIVAYYREVITAGLVAEVRNAYDHGDVGLWLQKHGNDPITRASPTKRPPRM